MKKSKYDIVKDILNRLDKDDIKKTIVMTQDELMQQNINNLGGDHREETRKDSDE